MKYCLISKNVVVNVIEADAEFIQEISADYDAIHQSVDCGIGWTWDGKTISAPAVTEAAPTVSVAKVRYIAVGSFFDRFGDQKWPILSSADPVVQALVMDCSVRTKTGINLDAPDVLGGINLLQSKGFKVSKESVLDAAIKDSELP